MATSRVRERHDTGPYRDRPKDALLTFVEVNLLTWRHEQLARADEEQRQELPYHDAAITQT